MIVLLAVVSGFWPNQFLAEGGGQIHSQLTARKRVRVGSRNFDEQQSMRVFWKGS